MLNPFDLAPFGAAETNLRMMFGMIGHTKDVDAIQRLIDGRIAFLGQIDPKKRGDVMGELCTIRLMINAMLGDVELPDDVPEGPRLMN